MNNITELSHLIYTVAKLFSDKIGILQRNLNKNEKLDVKRG